MSTGLAPRRRLEFRAVAGFFWNYGGFLGGRIAFFVATLILARLLAPDDFGLVAFALAFLAYVHNVTSHGIGETLVYRTDANDVSLASTAYWLAVGSAVVLTAVFWLSAPAIASFSSESSTMTWVLRVLSLQLVITALASTHAYLLRHSLDFRRIFVVEQAGGLFKGGVSVALAFAAAGVWSLVVGQLAGALASAVALWLVSGFRPKLVFDRSHAASTLRVGSAFMGLAILGEAARNIDFVIVGTRLGLTELGFYVLAFRLPELAVLAIFEAVWNVLFPFYSRLRELGRSEESSRQELVRGYRQTIRLGALFAFPLAAVVAALALPLVLTLYGERWRPSAIPLALIAVWAGLTAVNGMAGTVLKSIGRPGVLLRNSFVYLAVLLPSLWFAADFGIAAVAGAHVAAQVLWLPFLAFTVGRVLTVSWLETVVNVLPGLFVGGMLAAALIPLAQALHPALALAAGGPLAVVLYVVLLRLIVPGDFRALIDRLRELRASRADRDLAVMPDEIFTPRA